MAVRSTLIGGRLDFALVGNDRGYKVAVEVGTDLGLYARPFLDRWLGEILFCVDPYRPYAQRPWPRQADMLTAVTALQPHMSRVRLLQCSSVMAAKYLKRYLAHRPIDFVYLDGAHDVYSVVQDLLTWWPMVRPGGILAGDDYASLEDPGVQRGVDAFIRATHLPLQLTTDYNRPSSWFIEKPYDTP